MILSDIFIRRPVFAIVVNALMVALGLYGLLKLSVSELPSFDVPVVTISTTLIGASPDQMETQVTTLIEERVGSIAGVDYVTSTSSGGLSTVSVTFGDDSSVVNPLEAVRAKLDLAIAELPSNAETPIVQQLSTDQIPVMYLALSSKTRSTLELTELVQTVIRSNLASISGVGDVNLLGERKYAIRIKIYPERLAAYDLTPSDVKVAIQGGNASLPLGQVEVAGRLVDVTADTQLATVRQFMEVPLLTDDRFVVRLKDVADVVVAADTTTTGVLINGDEGLAIGVLRAAGGNALSVAQGVRTQLPLLRAVLPSDVTLEVTFDSTVFIQESVVEVFDTLVIAVVLVVIVILVFLGSPTASFVTLITIPISLIGTFAFMSLMDYSLNTFSLLAIVLAVGLVVDDAIVDVENVQRLIARGLPPLQAAFVGSREIGFAVIATTLTLASVFLPIGFLPGLMGTLFAEFAFTLVAAVVISGFISRTLSPMMCAYMLHSRERPHLVERVVERMAEHYRRSLDWSLGRRWLIFLVSFVVAGLCINATSKLPGELAPVEDQGYIYAQFAAAPSITFERLADYGATLSKAMADVPEGDRSLVLLGTPDANSGIAILMLKPLAERSRSAQEVGRALEKQLRELPGLDVSVLNPGALSGGGQLPVQMVVRTTSDYEALEAMMSTLIDEARTKPWLDNPASSLRISSPRLEVKVDRAAADTSGIDVLEIATAIATATGRFQVTTFTYGGRTYNVLMELDGKHPISEDIGLLTVADSAGAHIPLRSLVTVNRAVGASRLEHFDGQRSATLTAGLGQGASLATVLGELEALATASLPAGTSIDWLGASRQLKQANAAAGLVFVLALLFIYGFLAAQFESFRDPFVVLLVVPFSVLGGTVALSLVGGSLNLYSGIGLITLIGLVAKQGILVTEFANQLREAGRSIREAAVEAAATRLRPILMTSISMIAGAVPLLYATGSGARGREQIGAVIVGGLILGTLLALYVVPATYTLISRRHRPPLPRPPSDEEASEMLHRQFDRPASDEPAHGTGTPA